MCRVAAKFHPKCFRSPVTNHQPSSSSSSSAAATLRLRSLDLVNCLLVPVLALGLSYRSSSYSSLSSTLIPIFGSPSSSSAPSFQLCNVQVPVDIPQPFQDVAIHVSALQMFHLTEAHQPEGVLERVRPYLP